MKVILSERVKEEYINDIGHKWHSTSSNERIEFDENNHQNFRCCISIFFMDNSGNYCKKHEVSVTVGVIDGYVMSMDDFNLQLDDGLTYHEDTFGLVDFVEIELMMVKRIQKAYEMYISQILEWSY